MGGKLFEKEGAVRISTEQYLKTIQPELNSFLEPLGLAFKFLSFYDTKESHGNVNILVENSDSVVGTSSYLINGVNTNRVSIQNYLKNAGYKVKVNNDVISFLYKDTLQVDLLITKPSLFEYAYSYFSYNDLGGLIGRLARGLGLKHGQNGLVYTHYTNNGSVKLGDFTLTRNHDETLEILGLCPIRFKEGFKTLEDIYEYVTTSKYFGVSPYVLEDMRSKNQSRNKKRNTFIGFETYLLDNKEQLNLPLISSSLPANKLSHILYLFPSLKLKLDLVEEQYRLQMLFNSKFNGHILQDMFVELQKDKKRLGSFINYFKNKTDVYDFVKKGDEEIKQEILKEYSIFLRGTFV